MRRKWQYKIVSLGLVGVLFLTGCSKLTTTQNVYDYKKQSEDKLYFYSSDAELDLFLNDFYERHSRRNADTAINDMQLGTAGTAWKAWEALSLVWHDSSSLNFRQDSFSLMKKWLYTAPVDDYGYAWSSNTALENAEESPYNNVFGMGWPFPNYGGAYEFDWEFNTYRNDEGFKLNGTGNVEGQIGDGMFHVEVENSDRISFEKDLTAELMNTQDTPYLEFDIRWCFDGTFTENDVDDIYVLWQNTKSDKWHQVKVSECTALSTDITAVYNQHIYMPMYLLDEWGDNNTIKALKIQVRAKEGKKLSGEVNLNYVRGNYDSRHIDNGYNLLEATKLYYEYTNDETILKDMLNRCRRVVMFMAYNLDGADGLVDLSNFEGHDGGTISDGVAHTIVSSYWDILSLSPKSLYAQVLYYQSLKDLIYLELAAQDIGLELDAPSIKLFDGGTKTYEWTTKQLQEMADTVKSEVQKPVDRDNKIGFFDTEKGRFIEGFNMHGDVVDHGSTVFNNMAVAAGLATDEQGKKVLEWINGDRVVEGDMASGHEGDPTDPENYGIYDYKFAPRTNTLKNTQQYSTGHASAVTTPFAYSCQDGGAILFTTYYDLMARMRVNGVQNTYERLSEIKDWYLDVYEFSAEEYGAAQFYRAYYLNEGITMQGGGIEGTVGIDTEFLESAILYAIVPMAFFKLESKSAKELSVSPSLPDELEFWRMENLMFNDVKYDLEIRENGVILESVRGNTEGMKLCVKLETESKEPKVYVNGVELAKDNYTVSAGSVEVTVDFAAQYIEVR